MKNIMLSFLTRRKLTIISVSIYNIFGINGFRSNLTRVKYIKHSYGIKIYYVASMNHEHLNDRKFSLPLNIERQDVH